MKKLLGIMLLGALALSGCGNNEEFVITGNNPVVAAPVCADDAYTASSNQPLTVVAANGVLANDTPNGGTLAFQATSVNGGTITGAADGSFTYTPATNFVGTDTFSYTLANLGGSRTCTVTITVNAVDGFFVDAVNGSDATGSFTNGQPFATVQTAVNLAPTNATIVVRPGSYTGTVTLKNGQRLLGSGSALVTNLVITRPTLSGPIVMADSNTVDFLRIANSPSDGIDADGQGSGTISNCQIDTTAANMQGISAAGISGFWLITGNTVANTSGVGIVVSGINADTLNLRIESNQVTNCDGAIVLGSDNTSQLNVSVKNNTLANSGAGAGDAFELTCGGDSTFCLDMETNNNDDVYNLLELNVGAAALSVEQLAALTAAQPAGAGNTGTVTVQSGGLAGPPADVADGTCGF